MIFAAMDFKVAAQHVVYVLFFAFLLNIKIYGQPKYKIEYYSTEHGLSHRRVNCVLKDRDGFMWFGTWDGINRFDGHSFVSFKSTPGDKYQLGNSRIGQIVEDQSDHLWIQAYDYQIYRFDKKTEQFLPLSTVVNPDGKREITFSNILYAGEGWVWFQTKNDGIFCVSQTALSKNHVLQYKKDAAAAYRLQSNTINFFHIDKDGHIWIGTSAGLTCLEPSTAGIYTNSQLVPPGIASGINLTSCDEDTEHLYFGTADGNLIVFEKKSKSYTVRKIASGRLNALLRSKKRTVLYASSSLGEVVVFNLCDRQITTTNYRAKESLLSLYEDQTGGLWIEPEKFGAIHFEPQSRSLQLFSSISDKLINDDINNRSFWVLEDNKGSIWVNMKGGGLANFKPANKMLEYVLSIPDGANFHLPGNVVGHYYDKAGILWLSTDDGGIVKIVIQDNIFQQQSLAALDPANSENEVRGIYSDHQGRLWIGRKRGKLVVSQNNIRLKDIFVNEPPHGLVNVYSILEDSRGNLWLGTKENGLYKATPTDNKRTKYKLTHFLPDKNNPYGLSCNQIYSLLEDKQGRIWIGSLDNGLILIDETSNTTRFIHSGNAFKNYPKGAFQNIRHMCLDKDGNIWIGTTSGLLVLDANDQHSPIYQYKIYKTIPGEKESLGNNNIQFIYRDTKNRMWLATSGGGFSLAFGIQPFQTLKFRNYTTKDGMPNDYVLSCANDKQGNIWLATENGLAKFNPEPKVFRNYNWYDGLPKIAFSEASVCAQVSTRELVFGTRHGYLIFDPEHTNTNPIAANIVLTDLQINNEDVGPRTNKHLLKSGINYISGLTLNYNQNIISISYAILDHRGRGDQQGFAYRLVGFDSNWHNDRQLRRATYTNLPSGHYVFEVKSSSTDLYSNQPYRRLAITILPPWWRTWWAYLLYAIIIATVLFFFRRYAIAMMQLRHKIAVEQRLSELKMNFFTNISHELRTPLTLIVNPLEQVAKKGSLTPEISSYIDVARKNASRMVRFINQLLDLRKVQSDKSTLRISRVEIISFVKKISDYFTEAARSKRIKLEIVSEQKELIAWVDAEKIDVVIYNLLGNALKFTPEGKSIRVVIRFIPEEQIFYIAVQDQGPGVPKEKLEEIFELFNEGDNVAGRELKGTGIGLALSREFVHLHNGSIWAINNQEGGLTVTVQLKLGAAHYQQDNIAFVDKPQTTAVIEKPIEQQILPQTVNNGSQQDQQAPLVLLVEDNDELRLFIKGQLNEFYQVETAKDGEEGLQKATNLIPDLIVSDIMMPKMDGIQMLDKVKNDVNTSHIPVVLLSAKYSIESQIEGLKYGADYYITKPFNIEFLVASIDNLLRQRKQLFATMVEKKNNLELKPEPIVLTSKDEIFLKEVIHVVESKMGDSDFNIDSVAETMALSRTNFYKKFKSLTSLTPMEFVRDMRLQRAKQYLDAGGHNISEVAYLTGFSNPKYFSTCFKEKYHESPSDYLKSQNS